jgi:outer membrane protein
MGSCSPFANAETTTKIDPIRLIQKPAHFRRYLAMSLQSIRRILGIPLAALLLLTLLPAARPAAADTIPQYHLVDLYRRALDRAEQIQQARESVYITRQTKAQALSVLQPRVTAFGDATRYAHKEIYMGNRITPESEIAWGVRMDQSFTLNGRELTALEIAKTDIQRSEYNLDATTEAYLFEIASAFYDVLKAEEAVAISRANVERLETQVNSVKARLRLEEVAKTELFRTNAELSGAERDVIVAQNLLRLARAVLARLVDLPQTFALIPPPDSTIADEASDLATLKLKAFDHRSEMKALNLAVDLAVKEVQYTRGDYWPSVGVTGMYANSDAEPAEPYEPIESLSVGLNLTFRIYDGGLRRANLEQALARERQAKQQQRDTARAIAVEVERAFLGLSTRKSTLAALEEQLRFARENFTAVERQFNYGLANSVDVVDANTLLTTAERQLADARLSLALSRLELQRATGTFLVAHGPKSENP